MQYENKETSRDNSSLIFW